MKLILEKTEYPLFTLLLSEIKLKENIIKFQEKKEEISLISHHIHTRK